MTLRTADEFSIINADRYVVKGTRIPVVIPFESEPFFGTPLSCRPHHQPQYHGNKRRGD
jgi:hypothetical protein